MRRALALGLGGAALFVVCCVAVRGGPLGSAPYGDTYLYAHYSHLMAQGKWPYRDFFDEYPPLAQPLFLGVRALPGSFQPAFRWTMTGIGALAVLLFAAALGAAGVPRTRIAVAAASAGVMPLVLGPVTVNTYDLFPAALVAGALLAWVRGRDRGAVVLLALGVAAKTYPVVLLPLLLVEAWERGGRAHVRRLLAWFVGVVALIHLPFALVGPGGLRFSYSTQITRGLEVKSLGASVLLVLDRAGIYHAHLHNEPPGSTNVVGGLADAVATVSSLLAVVAVLLVAWLYARSRRRDPVLACAAAVAGFLLFDKVLSPQYISWLYALVPGAGAVAAGIVLGATGLTRVVFDRFQTGHPTEEQYKAALVWWALARNLVLALLYGWLVLRLRRSPASTATPPAQSTTSSGRLA